MKNRSTTLAIHTSSPFKATHLSIPPSPFSPLSPLSPLSPPATVFRRSTARVTKPQQTQTSTTNFISQPPETPLNWVWVCHMCRTQYSLGVTRRCLEDGHLFCPGTTPIKNWRATKGRQRRIRKHKACTSEFDYQGWKTWGEWRRREETWALRRASQSSDVLTSQGMPLGLGAGPRAHGKNCWAKCDFPSECIWGASSVSGTLAQQPATPALSSTSSLSTHAPSSDPKLNSPATSSAHGGQDDDVEMVDVYDGSEAPPQLTLTLTSASDSDISFSDILSGMNLPALEPASEDACWIEDLDESVKRRNRRSVDAKSPLSLESVAEESMDEDGVEPLRTVSSNPVNIPTPQAPTAAHLGHAQTNFNTHRPISTTSGATATSTDSYPPSRLNRTQNFSRKQSTTSLGDSAPIREPQLQMPLPSVLPAETNGVFNFEMGEKRERGKDLGVLGGDKGGQGKESFRERLKRGRSGIGRLF